MPRKLSASPQERIAVKKVAFLSVLKERLNPGLAAHAAGIARWTAYRWRHEDPEFAKAWDDVVDGHLDDIEAAFKLRATQEHNPDTLAGIFILNGYRRRRYAERRELTAPQGVPLQVFLGPVAALQSGGTGERVPTIYGVPEAGALPSIYDGGSEPEALTAGSALAQEE